MSFSAQGKLPNYDGKTFRVLQAGGSSQTTAETRFEYHQRADVVWGEYFGGEIVAGRLIGRVHSDGSIEMRYCHLDTGGTLCSGECRSEVVSAPNTPLRLLERWRWTGGREGQGESTIEEIVEHSP